jgi:hypothetical protein
LGRTTSSVSDTLGAGVAMPDSPLAFSTKTIYSTLNQLRCLHLQVFISQGIIKFIRRSKVNVKSYLCRREGATGKDFFIATGNFQSRRTTLWKNPSGGGCAARSTWPPAVDVSTAPPAASVRVSSFSTHGVNVTAPVVTPTAPVVRPTAPVVKPTARVVTSTAPVVTPTARVVTPTAPVVRPTARVVRPTAPVVIPTARIVNLTSRAVTLKLIEIAIKLPEARATSLSFWHILTNNRLISGKFTDILTNHIIKILHLGEEAYRMKIEVASIVFRANLLNKFFPHINLNIISI